MSARWAVSAWLAFVVACGIIVSRTEISTDLSAFLPRSPTAPQQILVDQLRDGVVSRLVLIGIEGATPERLARASKRMAAELRGRQDFASVNNGEDTGSAKDRDFLWRNRYLLSPAVTPDHFSPAALRASLEEDLRLLGSPAGILLQRILPADPTGELMRMLEALEGAARPDKRDGVWFSRDGQRALLVVQTRAAGSDIDAQERAVELIDDAFAKAVSGDPAAATPRLILSGPGVFSVTTRARVKHDALRFSIIATTLIGAMLLALYRSMRVLVLGLLPVASGALAGVAAVSLGFGSVHGITLGFGATLIGEGVDYAIYLFTQTDREAPQSTLARIWPTLRLGVATSVCGFSALLLSGFPGLAQLGLFSIAGLVVAVMITRWVLPALLPAGFNARAAAIFAPQVSALVRGAAALRYAALLLVVLAAAFVASQDAIWSDDLASLNPISPAEQELDKQMRRDLGAPDVRHLIVLTAPDAQAALEAAERTSARLQQAIDKAALEGFDSPATYLPSFAAQRSRQAALPAPETLRESVQAASRGLPFRAGLFEPFLREVAQAKAQPLVDRSSLDGTSLALKVDSLLVAREGGWAAMLPLRGVRDASGLGREIGQRDTQAVLLDLKRESDALYRTYRREAVNHALLGTAAIVVLLLIALRSPRRVFWVMVPLAAAVIVTTSVILLTGSRLSIFHLVGLLLVVAVGSNYSLFFDRQAASVHERERTLVSLLFANIATVIGFGLLAFSKVPVLHAIGSTVGLGAVLGLVFSAAFIVRPPQPAVKT